MFAGVNAFAIILFTRETRGSVILSKRAKKLRKETGDERYQCRSDAERASLAVLLKVSMTRPLYLLGTESIVFFFSVSLLLPLFRSSPTHNLGVLGSYGLDSPGVLYTCWSVSLSFRFRGKLET
jgi:hypothetical protein